MVFKRSLSEDDDDDEDGEEGHLRRQRNKNGRRHFRCRDDKNLARLTDGPSITTSCGACLIIILLVIMENIYLVFIPLLFTVIAVIIIVIILSNWLYHFQMGHNITVFNTRRSFRQHYHRNIID